MLYARNKWQTMPVEKRDVIYIIRHNIWPLLCEKCYLRQHCGWKLGEICERVEVYRISKQLFFKNIPKF